MNNPLDSVRIQLSSAFKQLGYPESELERFLIPDNVEEHQLTITKDNGEAFTTTAYRSEHRNTLGPYKGGIRFHQDVHKDEVIALSIWMSLKNALVNIPMGGGKGGLIVDPKSLSKSELEYISREFVRKMVNILGPHKDVPAPDVGTTPEIMSWMVDEYANLTGDTTKATFTGKPIENGGSEGRNIATSYGGKVVLDSWIESQNLQTPLTVAVQGMGNVGGGFVQLLANDPRYKLVAVSDSSSGIYNPDGLDPQSVFNHKQSQGNLVGFDAQPISNSELLLLPFDILVPSALEGVINEENANHVQAKIILELANGPTTAQADKILKGRVEVIPDILANAGGVAVSSFEWEQNLKANIGPNLKSYPSSQPPCNLQLQM
ncbi:MAG: Glu/Leu/Phe/Val dehydrogenase [Patescibacteria group bacterium]